jgi:hypothetical protein
MEDLFDKHIMIVIIAGGRDFNNYPLLEEKVSEILSPYFKKEKKIIIRQGAAKGVDLLGKQFALKHNFLTQEYIANWSKFGKRAGLLRNKEMADGKVGDLPADMLIVFWDGQSKGTKHMIDTMKERNKIVHVINY